MMCIIIVTPICVHAHLSLDDKLDGECDEVREQLLQPVWSAKKQHTHTHTHTHTPTRTHTHTHTHIEGELLENPN